jgi:hypothetical protein
MRTRPLSPCQVHVTRFVVTIGLMTGIVWATAGSTGEATSGCRTVIGRLDSAAADLDDNPATLETVGTLRGGIQADFAFRDFSPAPSGVLSAVQFYTATAAYTLRDGSVVSGINTGVFDAVTGEVTEFTTFTAKDGLAGDLGRIIVSGTFDLAAGVGKSYYHGHVCFAQAVLQTNHVDE